MKSLALFLSIELKLFVREKSNIIYIIGLPVLMFVVLGLIFNGGVAAPAVTVIDHDGTDASRALIALMRTSGLYRVERVDTDGAAAATGSRDGVVMVIPSGFGERVAERAPTTITVFDSTRDPKTAAFHRGLFAGFEPHVNLRLLGAQAPVVFSMAEMDVVRYSYPEYLLPGMIVMVILSLGLYNIALKLTIYRQYHQLKTFCVFRVREHMYFLTQVVFNLLVIITQTLLIFAVGALVFGVRFPREPLLFAGSLLLIAVFFLSAGFMLSSLFKSYFNLMSVINILYFPLLLFSSVYFPMESLPPGLVCLKYLFPTSYCVEIARASYLGGGDPGAMLLNTGVLLALSAVAVFVAVKKFRWYVV